MKTLKKISLKSASVLDDKQLKQVYGGSGIDGSISTSVKRCVCILKASTGETLEWPASSAAHADSYICHTECLKACTAANSLSDGDCKSFSTVYVSKTSN